VNPLFGRAAVSRHATFTATVTAAFSGAVAAPAVAFMTATPAVPTVSQGSLT
jgi:hypothetical protein